MGMEYKLPGLSTAGGKDPIMDQYIVKFINLEKGFGFTKCGVFFKATSANIADKYVRSGDVIVSANRYYPRKEKRGETFDRYWRCERAEVAAADEIKGANDALREEWRIREENEKKFNDILKSISFDGWVEYRHHNNKFRVNARGGVSPKVGDAPEFTADATTEEVKKAVKNYMGNIAAVNEEHKQRGRMIVAAQVEYAALLSEALGREVDLDGYVYRRFTEITPHMFTVTKEEKPLLEGLAKFGRHYGDWAVYPIGEWRHRLSYDNWEDSDGGGMSAHRLGQIFTAPGNRED